MTDRIFLQNMRFEATHGYHDYEQHMAQPFEVDIELRLNLQPAGIDDDPDQDHRLRARLRDRETRHGVDDVSVARGAR